MGVNASVGVSAGGRGHGREGGNKRARGRVPECEHRRRRGNVRMHVPVRRHGCRRLRRMGLGVRLSAFVR
eukprot:2392835-Pleurochrysis_carterae.AAC.2